MLNIIDTLWSSALTTEAKASELAFTTVLVYSVFIFVLGSNIPNFLFKYKY